MEKLYKHPILVICVITAVTVLLGLQLPKVEIDNNNLRFLPEKNEAKIIADYIDDTFGGQVMILVGLERRYKTVFEKDFLEKINLFSQSVENVNFVKTVNSIMTTQYITGDSESIIVSDMVPGDFSGTQEEIAELKRRIASWDLYRGSLVSGDHWATQILITLDIPVIDAGRPEVIASISAIQEIARNIFADSASVYFTGAPVLNKTINESIIADNILLIPLVIIAVLGMLFFSFRRLIFVFLPILTVIIAVVWTIGLAALLGVKLSIITTFIPVILVAVGHAYGVHIITHYVKDINSSTINAEEHRLIVIKLMKIMIKPVSLAALTTITGFISFTFTPIIPMREFGFCTSFGVITVYILAVFFIPSMLLLRKPESYLRTYEQNQRTDKFSNIIADFFLSIAKKEKIVLLAVAFIIFISIIGLSRIIVDNSVIDFFRNETDMSRSDRFIREHFAGSKDLNLVVQADTTEELLHPDVLTAMDGLSSYLTKHVPLAGKVAGFTDVIKRINQVFNVDQSPEGLKPSAQTGTDSFGFSDFGSFGFGNFAFEEIEVYDDANPALSDNFHDISRYTAQDILNFMDIASGISPDMSAAELAQEIKRLTNYDGFAYYEIPSDPQRYGKETKEELRQLVSNYLVLLSGDSNADYSNDPFEPTAIRAMIQLRTTGSTDSQQVIDIINEYAQTHFPENVCVIIGGSTMQEMAVTDLILNSQIISISISVIMIIIIIAISNKSLIAGIIGAVPLILAVLCNFTLMGFLGIKLNLGTALIASLTVCIGIDDAIHFLEFFKREHKYTEKDSLRRTFIACGRAIVVTAMSVGSGFAILAFSQFKIIAEFGILTALCMLSTTLVSLTVMPVLFKIIRPKFIYHETKE